MGDSAEIKSIRIQVIADIAANVKTRLLNIAKAESDVAKNAKKATTSFKKLGETIGRVATRRAIYGALRAISTSLKEGTQNLYQWSKMYDGKFAQSLDSFSTSLLNIKNSIAIAIAPIIQDFLVPIVETISSLTVQLGESISRFIAQLKGQNTYLGINTKAFKAYANAQRSVLGFDELNKLSGDSTSNYNEYFTTKAISADAEISIGGIKFTTDLTGEDFGKRLWDLFKAITSGLSILGIADWSPQGLVLRFGILETIFDIGDAIFSGEKLDLGKVKESFMTNVLKIVAGGLFGAALLTAIGGSGMVGFRIGAAITFLLSGGTPMFSNLFSDTTVADEFKKNVLELGIGAAIGGILGWTLTKSGKGALIGMEVGLALTMTIKSIDWQGIGEKYTSKLLELFPFLDNTSTATSSRNGLNPTGRYTQISANANGGLVSRGDLFIANENGAEMIGSMGSKTAVANNTQIVSGIAQANEGVIDTLLTTTQALIEAINSIPTPSIKIGDRDIYNASRRGSKLVGSSMVGG